VKTFLICPVRGHSTSETEALVARLEAEGWTVHWPPRDTDQNDPTGYRICQDNRAAISAADTVHVVWDGFSQGCLFDLGMAFALYKPVIPVDMPARSDWKSFQNMVSEWSERK
jgi:nucleoside 2-deoxyribosyltransferase